MKKTICILVVILCMLSGASAQVSTGIMEAAWGEDFVGVKKLRLSEIIGSDESGIYALQQKRPDRSSRKNKFALNRFDADMSLEKSVVLNLEEQGKKKRFEFVVLFHGEILLFTSYNNQKLKKKFLFKQKVNTNTLLVEGDSEKIAEIDYKGFSKFNSGAYKYRLSRDSSKFLVYYDLPYKRNESEKFGYQVFDESFNQIWERNITLPYTDGLFDVERVRIDNFGDVHLLGLIYKDRRKEKRKGKPNYKYQLLSYRNNGEDFIEYPIEIKGKFITDMQITINEDRDIICGGYYSNIGGFNIKGAYFLKIDDETGSVLNESVKDFGIGFMASNLRKGAKKRTKKKAKKGKNVEMKHYHLDNIIIKDDGGAVLLGEQFYISEVTTSSTSSSGIVSYRTKRYANYNHIIAVNMSANGEILWAKKIAKRQKTYETMDLFSSYALSIYKDKMFFIFNDAIQNLDYKDDGRVVNFSISKKSIITCVELNSEGEQKRKALFSTKERGVWILPKVCRQISDDTIILYGHNRKKQRFAKVTVVE